MDHLVATAAFAENYFAGKDNGMGGSPQPDNFPLKPPDQAAIAAIRARPEGDAASEPDSSSKPGQNE